MKLSDDAFQGKMFRAYLIIHRKILMEINYSIKQKGANIHVATLATELSELCKDMLKVNTRSISP